MSMPKINAIDIDSIIEPDRPRYSFCTLLTDQEQYENALASFMSAGFSEPECEFLYIDNISKNNHDAYSGINKFLLTAKGDYLIFCHQDIIMQPDNRAKLDKIIEDMTLYDDNWALLGNAGGIAPGELVYHLTENTGDKKHYKLRGTMPAKVDSLDEDFIVARRSKNLSISGDLRGFHMYGTDLCIIAKALGHTAYVVDFHLWHLGGALFNPVTKKTHVSQSFIEIRNDLIKKYQRTLSPRFIQTTCTILYISNSKLKNYLFNRKYIFSLQKRIYRWFIKK